MSTATNVFKFPARPNQDARDVLEREVLVALASGEDLAEAMQRVVESVFRSSGANRVEWRPTHGVGAAVGVASGARHELPLNGAGSFVLHGASLDPDAEAVLAAAAPIIRRRVAEERLAQTAMALARRNQALEDFAGLVAHELKNPLHAALVADAPTGYVEEALALVETLLEAARTEPGERTFVSPAGSVDRAVEHVGADVEITTDLRASLPLPPEPLRVILRNLLSNAVAAGAHHVHVAADHSSRAWRLLLDDDGVGLAAVDRYASGSGLGLSLSRRIAGRFGGDLELVPRPSGGTRAILEFPEAA